MKRILALIVFCAAGAVAQPGLPGPEGALTDFKAYMGLTDDQVNLLQQLQQQQTRALRPLREQIDKKTIELLQLLNRGGNPLDIGLIEVDIFRQYQELAVAARLIRQQIFAVLTNEQKEKLPALVNSLELARLARQAVQLSIIDDPVLPRVTAP